MACNPEVLKQVPLFALLYEEETAVLAGQVQLKKFAARQRIWKIGDSGGQAYVMISGAVRAQLFRRDAEVAAVEVDRCAPHLLDECAREPTCEVLTPRLIDLPGEPLAQLLRGGCHRIDQSPDAP